MIYWEGHLSSEEFVRFTLGSLEPHRLDWAFDHLDTCPECVHMLAVLGRISRYLLYTEN